MPQKVLHQIPIIPLRLIFFTLTSYFLCCRLLGEFLLPLSNILPHTYQDLYAIMKDIGMEYQAINTCPNGVSRPYIILWTTCIENIMPAMSS